MPDGFPIAASANGRGVVLLRDVAPEEVAWLWPGRVPLGKVTILDGDPGLGKSTLALDIAARVSKGNPMPDALGDLPGPAGVVLLTAEDGLGDTVRPRLDAAGADVGRVAALRMVEGEAGDRLPTVADVAAVAGAVELVNARLVVIDPLVAYLGTDVNSHRDQDVRSALAGLAELADRLCVAIVAIRHLNKMGGGNPLYRGGGSIGLIAAARSGLLVAPDPEDETETRRILASTKSNLARRPTSLAFHLQETEAGLRVRWEGESRHTAAALLSAPDGDERTALEDAKDFLRVELRGEPVRAKEIQSRGRDAGHATRTLQRAADALNVVKEKAGFREGWTWALPITQNPGIFESEEPQEPAPRKDAPEDANTLGIFDGDQAAQEVPAPSEPEDARAESNTRARDSEPPLWAELDAAVEGDS